MNRYFFYKVKKIKTKDITLMGLMLGLYLVLNATTAFSFSAWFLSVNIKLIPLFILAAYTDWLRTLIVGLIGGAVAYFLPTNLDAGVPLAYVFDYYIPLLSVACCSLFIPRNFESPINNSKLYNSWYKNLLIYSKVFLIWVWRQRIFIIVLLFYTFLGYVSKTIGGVLFWSSGKPQGENVWLWSAGLNVPNSINNFCVFVITIPGICYTLQPIKRKIY